MNTSGQRIVVFRKEESMKVLLHEIVHYVNLDFVHSSQAEIKKLVYRDFSIEINNRFVNLFEAYTDFTAIYNSVFNSILVDKNVYAIINDEIVYQKKSSRKNFKQIRLRSYCSKEKLLWKYLVPKK